MRPFLSKWYPKWYPKTVRMRTLKPRQIEDLPAGQHRIADSLYLRRQDRGDRPLRTIFFRWQQEGRRQKLSLGSWSPDRYADFLAIATRCRAAVASGHDPRIEPARACAPNTFREAAEQFYAAANFTSAKHMAQCRKTMSQVDKVLGDLHIANIQAEHVVDALSDRWLTRPVSAQRERRRIAEVMDFGLARNGLDKVNPAAWNRLKYLLKRQPKRRVQHFKALPYAALPAFYDSLPTNRVTACALRFLILTVTRTSETLGARWSDIDLAAGIWTIDRTKTGRSHRVALSRQAVGLLRTLYANRLSDFVFPGRLDGSPLSGGALGVRLRDMGYRRQFTVHGFRSSYKAWAREATEFPWELVELNLAHEVGNATERSYGRDTDLLFKRRPIMQAWADHVTGQELSTAKFSVAMAAE
jgi:integrase